MEGKWLNGGIEQAGFVLPEVERVVILRALQLGDLLCAVPAFRALRAALPQANMALLGLPWAQAFVRRFHHYLDSFIEFPGFPGFPERDFRAEQFPGFLVEMQARRFDLTLQMQGSGGIANSLVELFGARHTAGFTLPGQYTPDPSLYLEYPVHEPEVMRHLRLAEFLGAAPLGVELEFPLGEPDWAEWEQLRMRFGLEDGAYACVHPGSRSPGRRWPAEWFAQVAGELARRGLQVVLTGSQEEAGLVQSVAGRAGAPVMNLAGETSLGGAAAVLSRARLLVCNDTGVSHLASALRTPSVVLFTGSDPNRWAPLDRSLHRAVAWANAVGPDTVLDEVDDLLKEERSYAG